MTVCAHDPQIAAGDPAWSQPWGKVTPLDLETLKESDVVSLHVPLTDATRNMLDRASIARMKRDAILINAARGGVLDEVALADALRSGALGGAALDVFEQEPLSKERAQVFAGCPNLILTPHIAGLTVEVEYSRVAARGGESPRSSRRRALMPKLTLAQAETLVVATLTRCRTEHLNAESVTRALVGAEADGKKGHGLSRLPTYAAQAKVGKVDGFAKPSLEWRRPAAAVVDAGHGFAYPAIDLALAALPDAARQSGIAAVAIARSHHCGVLGHPVERLAEVGLVALMFANTPGAIAPWGGAKATFGTNPIAFACPLPGKPPIVVDLSLSKVARGNILAAKQKGERIPDDWALDAAGNPTTDPNAALAGTMLPLGDAKGTALALMVELLAAGLTGANFAADSSSFLDAKGPPPGTGQLLIAFDPAAFGGASDHFASLAAQIETQPGARLPGAGRLMARETAKRDGVTVSDTLLAEIEAL